MNNTQLVSVIVATKNEEKNIENCLLSVKKQTYTNLEIIVVDNNSSDKTKALASKFTKFVFNCGPERSAQRNFGAKKARGDYFLFIDADMALSPEVVHECITKVVSLKYKAIIIPEKSIGSGFWAQCKSLEKDLYRDISWIEAARFYEKSAFLREKGFNELMISGEDWDLSQRIEKKYNLGRIRSQIYHNEGSLSLMDDLKKKFYYAKHISVYRKNNSSKGNLSNQFSLFARYKVFFLRPEILFRAPVVGLGLIFMKTAEFTAGFFGFIFSRKSI